MISWKDAEVLSSAIMFVLEKYKYADKKRIVLVKKTPILDREDNIVGSLNYK